MRLHARLARRFSEETDLRHIMTERLLAIDVFTGSHRAVGDREVHVIRDGNVDRIDLVALLRQQLPPVGISPCLRRKFGGCGKALGVDIANRDDIRLLVGEKVLQIIMSH